MTIQLKNAAMDNTDMTNGDTFNILVADDDPISRKLLEKLLGKMVGSSEIILAEDGQMAWESLQTQFASLVIADWMMPNMDGLELCQKIRQARFERYVYIILLTARDDQKDVLAGLDAGADDYIRKPFDQHELELRVKGGMRIIRLETELARKNQQLLALNEKLEEVARIDDLTKIGNRRSFYESIERLHSQTTRYGTRYGLLICDVDHFKLYNDTLGHQAGDKALYEVAQAIKANIRPSDELFRYGGEEIVVLLSEQDVDGAVATAQRVCDAVFKLGAYHPKGIDGKISISVGAAASEGKAQYVDWKQVLEKADSALYRAKAEGRNRVCRYDSYYALQHVK